MSEKVDGTHISLMVVIGVRVYREALAAVLGQQPGFKVTGTAADSISAIGIAQQLQPHIILFDTSLVDSCLMVATLLQSTPNSRMIALGVNETEREVISYAEAGVSGYATRGGNLEDLVEIIRSVRGGQLICSPQIAAVLLQQVTKSATGVTPPLQQLTPRELQIIELIETGFSNKEIASRLCIQVSTVKNHVHNILEKAGATRRGQAAARLRRQGFVSARYFGTGSSSVDPPVIRNGRV